MLLGILLVLMLLCILVLLMVSCILGTYVSCVMCPVMETQESLPLTSSLRWTENKEQNKVAISEYLLAFPCKRRRPRQVCPSPLLFGMKRRARQDAIQPFRPHGKRTDYLKPNKSISSINFEPYWSTLLNLYSLIARN